MHGEGIGFGYGFWSLVLVNVGIFVILTLSYLTPLKRREWGAGWHRIHRAKGTLVTDGPYAWVRRHPQYSGLFLISIGLLVQWPTIITVATWPILIAVYYRLARREEREAEAVFGDAYRAYEVRVPMFVPWLRRLPEPRRRTMTMRSTETTIARDRDCGARRRGSTALALAGLVAAAGAPRSAWAQERGADWGWGMHPMSWMWGAWGLGMMLMMLVFWGLVIVGIVLAIRWLAGHGDRSRSDRALDILRERYARGEINKDEFEAKQRDLR